MSDVDELIRDRLGELIESAPLPPSVSEVFEPGRGRSSGPARGRWVLSALAIAVVLGAISTVVVVDRRRSTSDVVVGDTSSAPADNTGTVGPALVEPSFPAGFDLADAIPVLRAAGSTPVDAAAAYFTGTMDSALQLSLANSLDDPTDDLELLADQQTESSNGVATLAWRRWAGNVTGTVYLRQAGTGWDVIAVATDGLAFTSLTQHDDAIAGSVTNSLDEHSFFDVLDLGGSPVPAAPYPEGWVETAEVPYGTAAEPGDTRLDFEITIPPEPVRIRVFVVGGGISAVTEFVLNASSGP